MSYYGQQVAPGSRPVATIRRNRTIRFLRRLALYAFVTVVALTFFAPFFWTITTSLKRVDEVILFPPVVFPIYPSPGNYPTVFEKVPFALFYRNTAVITLFGTLGTIVSTTLVAYGFARRRFPGRMLLFMLVLSTMMLPGEVTLIPQFLIFRQLGWLDTPLPLIVPEYFAVGAFYIFLMRQFMMTIPRDFDEAAMLDGASTLQILLTVLLPLIQPAIITVAILSFLNHWNDFFAPLIYLNTTEKLTLSVGLRYFQAMGGYADIAEPREHLLMAASLMATVPCVVLFFVAQRYFVQGIVMSGIKG
jgi:ABC-type glycerol-3-phosphate transport system permease component